MDAVTIRAHQVETDLRWQLTMEHCPVGMALISPGGSILEANAALCDTLGHDRDALTSLTTADITHPDDLVAQRRLVMEALAGGSDSFRVTQRCVGTDGSVIVGELSMVLMRDDRGEPIHFIAHLVDLSERRRTEAVFDAVSVGLLVTDADGAILTANQRMQELLALAYPDGLDAKLGQPGFIFDADQTRPLEGGEMPSVRAAAGEFFQDLVVWVGEDQPSRRALSVTARPVRDDSGDLVGGAVECHDVTDLMRAIRVKDDFLASISHELRTPLTSALAYLELLEGADESLEPAVRTQVAAVRRNAMRLSRLVADLLFTATATSGAPVIDPFQVDLAAVLREAVEAARPDAQDGRVSLEVDLPASLDVVMDGIRLRQVADNLIANAIKYTLPDGSVRVALTTTDVLVEIVVADSGEGIDEADLADIFSTFVRGQNARRRVVPGTGLGLTIVRTIVEAHGGEVSLESAVGVGTTVRLTLPR